MGLLQFLPALLLPRALAFASAGPQGAIIAGPALGGALYVLGGAAVYACSATRAPPSALNASVSLAGQQHRDDEHQDQGNALPRNHRNTKDGHEIATFSSDPDDGLAGETPVRFLIEKLGLALALGALALQAVQAQQFPSRPIRVIVGFGPGGVADITARTVSQGLATKLGKPVVVENMPGAGGINAAVTAARAQPDGHTLFLMSNLNAVSPSLFKTLPYDPVKQFQAVSMIGAFDLVMVVDQASPIRTVKDVIDQANKAPDRFNIGTVSIGSTQHLSAQMFALGAKLSVPTVPFKASGDVITALRGGVVQVGFETLPAVAGQIKSGGLRAVAVTSARRNPALPNVPTVAESGVLNYEAASWNGLAVPAATPKEIVARLNEAVVATVRDTDTARKLEDIGLQPQAGTPEAFQALLRSEIEKWRGVIEKARIEKQ